jgi:hypothetical protein
MARTVRAFAWCTLACCRIGLAEDNIQLTSPHPTCKWM